MTGGSEDKVRRSVLKEGNGWRGAASLGRLRYSINILKKEAFFKVISVATGFRKLPFR
jgi:hypothetical protein